MRRMFVWTLVIFGALTLGACREPSGVERKAHPENWLLIHGEKVKNSGAFSCDQCHPPAGDWPEAPTCASCHGGRE